MISLIKNYRKCELIYSSKKEIRCFLDLEERAEGSNHKGHFEGWWICLWSWLTMTSQIYLYAAAAAAAKSLQSCLTLCNPIDCSPPGSPVPGILQARTLEWVAISFSNAWKWKVKVKSLGCVWLLATPRTAAYQAHGIFQARVLEWGVIAFSKHLSNCIL